MSPIPDVVELQNWRSGDPGDELAPMTLVVVVSCLYSIYGGHEKQKFQFNLNIKKGKILTLQLVFVLKFLSS